MKINHYYNSVRTIQGENSLAEIPKLVSQNFSSNCRILLLAWSECEFDIPAIKNLDEEGRR